MKRKKKTTGPGAAAGHSASGNGALAGPGARAGRVRVVWPGPASPRPAHPRTWHPVLGGLEAGRVFELPAAVAARYLAAGLLAVAGAEEAGCDEAGGDEAGGDGAMAKDAGAEDGPDDADRAGDGRGTENTD